VDVRHARQRAGALERTPHGDVPHLRLARRPEGSRLPLAEAVDFSGAVPSPFFPNPASCYSGGACGGSRGGNRLLLLGDPYGRCCVPPSAPCRAGGVFTCPLP
jgi:hypothetical protein